RHDPKYSPMRRRRARAPLAAPQCCFSGKSILPPHGSRCRDLRASARPCATRSVWTTCESARAYAPPPPFDLERKADATPYGRYSLLRTLDDTFALAHLGASAGAVDMIRPH